MVVGAGFGRTGRVVPGAARRRCHVRGEEWGARASPGMFVEGKNNAIVQVVAAAA